MGFSKDEIEKVSFYGLKVMNTTLEEMTDLYDQILLDDELKIISTPNTEIVMAAKNDKDMKDMINQFDIVIPDGIGLIYGSRIRKVPMKERVTGFDSSIKMLEIADKKEYSLYILGGAEGVAKRAAERVKEKYSGVRIAGYHNGYFDGAHNGHVGSDEDKKILKEIEENATDILFVGMGYPKQDKWIFNNKDKIKAKIAIGNGGVMNILAGDLARAPSFFANNGLEWLYRLVKEPKRIKRQVVLPLFLLNAIFDKNSITK